MNFYFFSVRDSLRNTILSSSIGLLGMPWVNWDDVGVQEILSMKYEDESAQLFNEGDRVSYFSRPVILSRLTYVTSCATAPINATTDDLNSIVIASIKEAIFFLLHSSLPGSIYDWYIHGKPEDFTVVYAPSHPVTEVKTGTRRVTNLGNLLVGNIFINLVLEQQRWDTEIVASVLWGATSEEVRAREDEEA